MYDTLSYNYNVSTILYHRHDDDDDDDVDNNNNKGTKMRYKFVLTKLNVITESNQLNLNSSRPS